MKKIGILGGMGPAASASLYSRIVAYCQQRYNATQDTDYPQIMLYSIALEGFDESGITDEALVLKQLLQGIKMLEMSQCDFIIMPCNTIHYFIDQLRLYAQVPIMSIIEEVAGSVKSNGQNQVLLLGSETTLALGIYQKEFELQEISYLQPNQEEYEQITTLILDVMGGKVQPENKEAVLDLIHLKKQLGVVLGCTELPLAITQQDLRITLYDSLQILAESAVEYAMGKKEMKIKEKKEKISYQREVMSTQPLL
ncbi:amino acid racemase [Candidatus Woesearchaeota archaeon]|nr:amino acid racemase [Candidatus Woesearchaeota archaeon]